MHLPLPVETCCGLGLDEYPPHETQVVATVDHLIPSFPIPVAKRRSLECNVVILYLPLQNHPLLVTDKQKLHHQLLNFLECLSTSSILQQKLKAYPTVALRKIMEHSWRIPRGRCYGCRLVCENVNIVITAGKGFRWCDKAQCVHVVRKLIREHCNPKYSRRSVQRTNKKDVPLRLTLLKRFASRHLY